MRNRSTGIQTFLLIALAFLAGNLLGIRPIATAQDQPDEVSFATPEDAITAYMEGVAQGDVAQIMQAYAVDELSAGFRFDLYIDYVGYLTMSSPAPSDDPFFAELNKGYFSWQLLRQVEYFAYRLLANETEVTTGHTPAMDVEGAAQFVEALNSERLAEIEIVAMGLPEPELAANERTVNQWNRSTQIYGADDYTERVVLFLFEGNYYYIGFTLLRYGDNWKISNAASPLGNTPFLGTPEEITKEAFQGLISSD